MKPAGSCRLALGTVQFGLPYGIANQTGQVGPGDVGAMLDLAAAAGVTMLDTAVAYGQSEQVLGEAGTARFQVVSKLPACTGSPDGIRDWVAAQCRDSLTRLGCRQLYGLLLHRPSQLTESRGAELYAALRALQQQGLVRKIGISVYGPSEIATVLEHYPVDLVQAPFNLVDRRLLTSGWLDRLSNSGVEVHVRSAFLQGLLLLPTDRLPERFAPWKELFLRWHRWLCDQAIQPLEAALAFAMAPAGISRVVVGADSTSQLSQILAAAAAVRHISFPDIASDDEALINPARWSSP